MASKKTRVFRTQKTSKASVLLKDDAVAIIGDSRHFVVVDERGTTIKGPVSVVADATGFRRGGLFVDTPYLLQLVPSTMVTPIPHKLPFPPVFAVQNIAKDLAFFMALMV